MNQRFFSSEEKGLIFFGVVIELWFLIIGKKVFFLIFNSMMPKFLIFLPFFSFCSHTLVSRVFFLQFSFLLSKFFFLTFLSQLLTVKNLLIVLGTWGDFLRWFRYLDFFFSFRREIIMMSLCFFHMILRAQRRKKRIGLIFFWLGEQKKFFEWFFSRNRWSKWPYDFHSVIFFVQV